MNNLLTRALTGTIFVTVLIGAVMWHRYSFIALFLIITILGLWEFYKLAEKDNNARPQKLFATVTGTILFLSFALAALNENLRYLSISLPILFLPFITELYTKSEKPFTNIAYTLLGVFYIALPFALWNLMIIHGTDYFPRLLLGYFFILWSNDTGAYLVGISMGKHKLFERISPKKTWEGAIGGGCLSLFIAYLISFYFNELRMMDWIIIATIVVIFGSLGDLAKSLLKRSINVKDSGNILPGHGGIIDRFDALLLSSPFIFSYLYFNHLLMW